MVRHCSCSVYVFRIMLAVHGKLSADLAGPTAHTSQYMSDHSVSCACRSAEMAMQSLSTTLIYGQEVHPHLSLSDCGREYTPTPSVRSHDTGHA